MTIGGSISYSSTAGKQWSHHRGRWWKSDGTRRTGNLVGQRNEGISLSRIRAQVNVTAISERKRNSTLSPFFVFCYQGPLADFHQIDLQQWNLLSGIAWETRCNGFRCGKHPNVVEDCSEPIPCRSLNLVHVSVRIEKDHVIFLLVLILIVCCVEQSPPFRNVCIRQLHERVRRPQEPKRKPLLG